MAKLEDLIYKAVTKTVPTTLPKSFLYFGAGQYLDHFNVLIEQRGVPIIHTKGLICPCAQSGDTGGTGLSLPDCVACGGLGLVFPEETNEELKALVSNLNEGDVRDSSGAIINSSINVSVKSAVSVDTGSRIIVPQAPTSIMWTKKYNEAQPLYVLPFNVDSAIVLATKGPKANDPLEYLKEGVDFTLNREKRQLHVINANHGMMISGTFSGIPHYIVSSIEKAGRGIMSNLESDAEYIQLPSFLTANRADILLRSRYNEGEEGVF